MALFFDLHLIYDLLEGLLLWLPSVVASDRAIIDGSVYLGGSILALIDYLCLLLLFLMVMMFVLIDRFDKEHQGNAEKNYNEKDVHYELLVADDWSGVRLSKVEEHVDHEGGNGWRDCSVHLAVVNEPLFDDQEVHESEKSQKHDELRDEFE